MQQQQQLDEQQRDDLAQAFPTYMQPEKIMYLGVHVAEIRIRLHLMQDKKQENNHADSEYYSFSYWDACAKCVTMDVQKLMNCRPEEKQFQDIRLDVGHLTATEYSGVESRQLLSIGLRQRVVEFDEVTMETLMTRDGNCQRPPWPSTAAVLLDIPPPLETLVYETRERHALQLRYISLEEAPPPNMNGNSEEKEPDRNQSMVHFKMGAASIHIPRQIHTVAMMAFMQAKACIIPPPKDSTLPPPKPPVKTNNLMRYKVDLDGACIQVDPLIQVRLTLSTMSGELSSAAGFSIETVLAFRSKQYCSTLTLSTDKRNNYQC